MKKGQVTVFIIIGIIILIALGLLFYFRTQLFETQLALEQDQAEGDAAVVQAYVSACLDDVATEALVLLGQHSGYINLSRHDIHDKTFIVNPDPTESDAVLFNTIPVPYWWYEDSEHSCTRCSITTKNVPSLELMKEQVNIYVEEQLQTCLDGFTSLEQQGFQITAQSPTVETITADDVVYVQLSYPVTIIKQGATSQLEHWYVEIPIPLENIYNAAIEIMSMQISDQFLEQITVNVISAYSGIDEDRLPPFAGFTEGYAVVYWVQSLVKEQLQHYINTYIPLIQIQGSNAAVALNPSTDLGTGFFALLFRESTYSFGTIETSFIYDNFDWYMEITPHTGELIKPEIYSQEFPVLIPTIQTNHYRFYYDISYPVVVSLRDQTALNNAGYTFFFALEANMRDNRNLIQWAQGKGTFGPWDPSLVEVGLKEGVDTTYPVGFDLETNETIYATYEEPPQTLMCDVAQRISGDVAVSIYDGVSGNPIKDASVAFRCGSYETCAMGATDAEGNYESTFPICIGGVVVIDAQGYYTHYIDLDTMPDQKNTIIALVEPIKEIPVTVKFIPTARLNESLSTASLRNLAFDMDATDNVLITIEKQKDHAFEAATSQVVSVISSDVATLQLVSGTYTVTGLLLDDEGISIPARTETISGEEIEYPAIEMETGMVGAVYLDESSGLWTVDRSDLDTASEIVFYVFRINDPHVLEDLAELGELTNYSLVYRDVIEPTWS